MGNIRIKSFRPGRLQCSVPEIRLDQVKVPQELWVQVARAGLGWRNEKDPNQSSSFWGLGRVLGKDSCYDPPKGTY